jgi:Flp pilus assembly protein TadD
MDWMDSLKLWRHVLLVVVGFAAVLPGTLLAQSAPTSPAPASTPVTPPTEPTLLQQATQAIQNKDYPLALQLLDQYLASQPRDDRAYYKKADVLRKLDRKNEAVEASRQAAELNPRNSSYWNSHCWSQILANQPLQARTSCEKAKALNPDNWAAIVNLGHTWLLAGDFATAQTYYRNTIWRIKSDEEIQEGLRLPLRIGVHGL